MALIDCPHPALQLDEVVEKILEFAASGRPFKTTATLRTVCKQWRDMSFKGLRQSTSLPAIRLRINEQRRWSPKINFEALRKRFPRTCPTQIALSEPRLPIELNINRLPLPQDVTDIQEFSRAITSIRVYPVNGLNENVTYDFKLPNLRSIVVVWKTMVDFEPWQRLLNYVLGASSRHVVLKYVIVRCNRSQLSIWPVAPPPLRELEWNGLTKDLQRYTTPALKRLVSLKLRLKRNTSEPDRSIESAALTEILARHSSTLEKAEINLLTYGQPSAKPLKLPGGPLPQLLSLESGIPLLLSRDESNPTNMPKLKNLRCIVGYHLLEESDGFKVSKVASNTLIKLGWSWKVFNRRLGRLPVREQQVETNRENEICRELREEHFPVFPELKELNINDMPFPIALALMPKVFNFMTNLTRLTVHFVQKVGRICSSPDETDDLHKILIGGPSGDIPTDADLWPGLLKDNENAITSLKHLSYLGIRISNSTRRDSRHVVIGRFIFYAAFFQMQELKMIRLSGRLSVNFDQVDWDMMNEWRHAGREIDAHGVHCGNRQ